MALPPEAAGHAAQSAALGGGAAHNLIAKSGARFARRKMRAGSTRIAVIAAAEAHFAGDREGVFAGAAEAVVFID